MKCYLCFKGLAVSCTIQMFSHAHIDDIAKAYLFEITNKYNCLFVCICQSQMLPLTYKH